MMILPSGRQGQAARSARPAPAPATAQPADTAPISAQRCLPVTGQRALAPERRCAARTQLGMPALTLPSSVPPSSAKRAAPAGDPARAPAPARRGPPPLPARFALPKVVVAARPLLPDTVPARRPQLQDVTAELDIASSLSVALRRPAASSPGAGARPLVATGGVRGMLAALLVRWLSVLAPSLQIQPAPRD